jgi:hypothetical protein
MNNLMPTETVLFGQYILQSNQQNWRFNLDAKRRTKQLWIILCVKEIK